MILKPLTPVLVGVLVALGIWAWSPLSPEESCTPPDIEADEGTFAGPFVPPSEFSSPWNEPSVGMPRNLVVRGDDLPQTWHTAQESWVAQARGHPNIALLALQPATLGATDCADAPPLANLASPNPPNLEPSGTVEAPIPRALIDNHTILRLDWMVFDDAGGLIATNMPKDATEPIGVPNLRATPRTWYLGNGTGPDGSATPSGLMAPLMRPLLEQTHGLHNGTIASAYIETHPWSGLIGPIYATARITLLTTPEDFMASP